jgi:putative ABC transport system ATP-binding protein
MGQPELLPLVQLHAVDKEYPTPAGPVPALRGINLQVGGAEFVAVVGKSGAGKSTLANMVTGIDRPTGGAVLINGTAIHELRGGELDRWRGLNVGIVFQFFQLLPSLSLINNVAIPMDVCGTLPARVQGRRALDLLSQVGLADHAYKTPSEISGGQQQRVAIARALANDPPLIVADEPTGNLDSATSNEILDLFEELVEAGKTLIVVTHDEEIAARASAVIHIADGRIVCGTNGGARGATSSPDRNRGRS